MIRLLSTLLKTLATGGGIGGLRPYWGMLVNRYPIVNIHPALIPSFRAGYYGARARGGQYGAKVSGATVHFVDEGTIPGLSSCRNAPVLDDDTPETLAARVLEVSMRYCLRPSRVCEGRPRGRPPGAHPA